MFRRRTRSKQHPGEDDVFIEEDSPLAFPEPANVTAAKRRRRGLWALAAMFAALITAVLVLYFSPLLTLRHIEFSGNDLLTDARAEELVGPLRGIPILQVGTGDVREALAEENAVADISTRAELPDTLHVEITEYPPVAEVHDDDAVLFYSAEGEVIREFAGAQQLDSDGYATPEISSAAALEDEAVFDTVVSVLGQLPSEARDQLDSATAESIDSVALELADGRTVLWGSDDRGEEKAAVLEAILRSEADEFSAVDTIDISTPSSPVTR